jgi:histidine decarboxylase
METARFLLDEITALGLACRLNDLSTTVVLERPMDDKFVKRWQLACEEDIAHVVVMPNVTKDKIQLFVQELKECRDRFGPRQPERAGSPLTQLYSTSWGGRLQTVTDLKRDNWN